MRILSQYSLRHIAPPAVTMPHIGTNEQSWHGAPSMPGLIDRVPLSLFPRDPWWHGDAKNVDIQQPGLCQDEKAMPPYTSERKAGAVESTRLSGVVYPGKDS
ncbi:hypothetical protein NW761_011201 [Fusarium oxysporum]|uniref:Uncharacterized protein n=1 Tax=Fusarium oxysporum f. sp. vasinfectum 25433 TaxID=1089449 RepID=X0N7P8_FUSOX|nr:hypothetical protein FOTG_05864 [Fusarium oxysporum f. sp. vasinfectum 25433]KAJ4031494.1 hypothetical protein NW758_012315 [Fusarium oxysporum]KAJ4060699.1 hypothetical protein NW753_004965 [Fusarium oxysporum]KAJ4064008.1 hypothetical protein NW763_004285 [Fusarium oxysporum]KAJ4077086.1 hypothetical protein NW756_012575 [Fusarium oxysporum]